MSTKLVGVVRGFPQALILIFGHDHDHGHGHGHSHDAHTNGSHVHDEEAGRDHHHKKQEKEGLLEGNGTSGYGATNGHSHDHHDHDQHDHGKSKKKKNINLEAAHLHVITDLVQSIGVALAGVIIYFRPDWQIVDPIITIIFSVLIVFSTLRMLQKSTHVLLEGVPEGVDPESLRAKLLAIDGVSDVHDLHVWMLSIDRPLVTVHLKAVDTAAALKAAHDVFAK